MRTFRADAIDFFVRYWGPEEALAIPDDDPRFSSAYVENLYLRYLTDDEFHAAFLEFEAARDALLHGRKTVREALRELNAGES